VFIIAPADSMPVVSVPFFTKYDIKIFAKGLWIFERLKYGYATQLEFQYSLNSYTHVSVSSQILGVKL